MNVNADIYPESSDDNADDDEDSNVNIYLAFIDLIINLFAFFVLI